MAEFPMEDTFVKDETWVAPKAKNQEFEVLVWGGGGAGSCSSFENPVSGAGGGSGFMNAGTFHIEEGERIDIKIGAGGIGLDSTKPVKFANQYVGESGGTTFFGDKIFATGGSGGNGNVGGIGGFNGGAPGMPGDGNYGAFGVSNEVKGIQYSSGGGGAAINARGVGGAANRALGDAGTSGGGAGCFVYSITKSGDPHIRTGNGGHGLCIIKYIREA